MEDLYIRENLTIPARDLTWESVRSSGPGGQNVNKLATKVLLTFHLPQCRVLYETVKNRVRLLAGRRVNREGLLRMMSQRHRSREQNLEECRKRLAAIIRKALVPPTIRKKSRTPLWAKKKRLENKRKKSQKKALRRPPSRSSE